MTKKIHHIILFLGLTSSVFTMKGQDTVLISGQIIGIGNQPVQNVYVTAEGIRENPVITDSSGQFVIALPQKNQTLIISPPDEYKYQKFFLGRRLNPVIKLTSSDLNGNRDEAKTFFEFTPRRDLISSISILDDKNIPYSPHSTVDEYIKGNVSGIWGTGRSGMPGSGSVNYIRGIHSMNSNAQPLYIIDGLPLEIHGTMESFINGFSYNPLNGLNPADITDVTIMKDNTCAGLYGVRGSNGIIFIETLKPEEVETVIDLSLRTGIATSPQDLPQLNSSQYRTLAKEVLMTSGIPEEEFPELYPGLYVTEYDDNFFKYNNNTNWQNIIFRNATMYDIYFRIHGGDAIARYGLSLGYQDKKGIIKNTEYNRFSVRFAGDFNMFSWLKFRVSSNLTSNTSLLKESGRVIQTSPILTSLLKNPMMIPYSFDTEGNRLIVREDVDELGVSNPLSVIEGYEAKNLNYRFMTTFRTEADLSGHLKFNSLIGINFNSLYENIFMPNLGMVMYYNGEAFNASKSLNNYLFSFATDNYFNYTRNLQGIHRVIVNTGLRLNTNKFQSDWGIAKNSHENDEYRSLQNGTAYLREVGGQNGNWNRIAFYSQLRYSFLERYSLDVSASLENSTRIGPNAENVIFLSGEPFGFFYGAGLSWRLSNESFLQNINWLDDLKVRLSYGKSGNDDIGNYDAFNYFYLVHYRNTTGMVPGPATNETLSFEEVYHLNGGMDFTTWGNRFSASFDLFRNRTKNLLVNSMQEDYMGYAYLPVNNGEIENRGWEGMIAVRIIQTHKFSWDAALNVSKFHNEVISIANNRIITPFPGGEYLSAIGDNLLNFYGLKYKGVYASSEEAAQAGLVNQNGIPFRAGDAIFEDISGPDGERDGIINRYDRTIIGSPIPDLTGGISSTLRYGNWHLDIFVQGVYGNEVFNYLRSQNENMTGVYNQSTATLNRWQYEGHETNVPRSLWEDPVGNAAFSSRWIEDGSWLRLKNLTLGYTLTERFLVFRDAELYISGTNLITLTNYLGYDPEFAISYQTMEQGIDYGLTPYSKTFLIGIKLGL